MSTRNYYETNDVQSTATLVDSAADGAQVFIASMPTADSLNVSASDTKLLATNAVSDSYEYDGSSSSATRISTTGSTQTHSITAGDVDWIYFDITSAGEVVIETTGSGDTKMYLYNSSLSQLEYNDDGGTNYNARIARYLSAGRYYVSIQGYSSTTAINSYGVKVSVSGDGYEPDNSSSNATLLSAGTVQTHSLSPNDVDWVYFDVTTSGVYTIETTGNGDTKMYLYNSSLSQLTYNDDGGSGYNARISLTLSAGRYYAKVQAYNSSSTISNYGIKLTAPGDGYEPDNTYSNANRLSIGTVQTHSLSAGDIDWVYFDISTAGRYEIQTTGSGDTTMNLYNSSLTELAYDDDSGTDTNAKISRTFAAGRYYVKVKGYSSSTVINSYGLKLTASGDSYEPDNSISNASLITLGSTQTHSLSSGDVDWVYFDVTTSGNYVIETTGSGDTTMRLYNSSQTELEYDDDDGTDYNARISRTLSAGRYYVKVQAYSSSAEISSYGLRVSSPGDSYESDNTRSTARVISVGSTQTHSIHSTSDVDWMKFTPTTSGYYTFYTDSSTGGSGDPDMMLSLYNSSGTLLVCDDDSGSGYNAKITYYMSAGSTYYLCAESTVDEVVSRYTVSAVSGANGDAYEPDNSRSTAVQLSVDNIQDRSIHVGSDQDWVYMQVNKTGYYTIQTEGSGDTLLALYNQSGSQLDSDDDSGVGRNAAVTYYLQAGTRYYARVTSYGSAVIPSYTLSLTQTGGGGDAYESDDTKSTANRIVAGETQSRSIHIAGDVDWVRIRPVQSGTYQIQTSGDGDMKLNLYSANGTTLLASDDDSGVGLNARIGYNLQANTDYYIKAYAYDSTTTIDDYALTLTLMASAAGDAYESDNTPTSAKSISLGETQTHSIHIANDVDWVTFTPTVTAEYTIQTVGSGLNCDTQLYLYSSLANAQSGNYMQWDDDSGSDRNAMLSRVLNAGTTYYIKARAWSSYTIPSYGLKITQNNGVGADNTINGDEYESDNLSGICKPIAVGREYTHSIHTRSDTDWVRFYTHQTGTYTIQTTGDSDMSFIIYKREPGGPLVPYENGQAISYGGAGQNALYRVRLETDNWYYVRVTTNNRASTTSSYGIRVDIDPSSVSGDQYEKLGGKANDNAPSRATWLTLGSSQVHSIHTPGDTDWVAYKAANNSSVIFTAQNDESKQMRIFIYEQNNNGTLTYLKESTIGSYGITSATLDSEAGKTYYVRAQALSPTQTVSSYSFSATYVKDQYEDDDTSLRATTLALGSSQTHNIHRQGDEDWYKLVVTSAGTYEFETDGNGDTYGILYRNSNGSNTVVTRSGSGGEGANMKIRQNLSAGTYYLRVTGENNTLVDYYTIVARRPITQYDEPNDSQSAATSLSLNTTKTGSFHTTSDVDYYRISASSAGTYKLTANSSDVAIELTAGSQRVSGVGSVSITLSAGATVYAKVQNANGSLMDNYTVRAEYTAPVVTNRAENYVVLFAGGGDISNNHVRYYYNFYDTYMSLVQNYDIPRDHIYVLYADGTNPAPDSIYQGHEANSDMSYANGSHVLAATKGQMRTVFNELSRITDSNDHLLVYVYDHGADLYDSQPSRFGDEYIVPYDANYLQDYISGAEFNSMVSNIGAGYQTYLFAQCYSGGILDSLNFNRSGVRMYGAASDTHYSPSSSWVNSRGEAVGGFAYEVSRSFETGVQNTSEFRRYLITENYSRTTGHDSPYEKGSSFSIFAQS